MAFNRKEESEDTDNWNIAKGFTNEITLEHIKDLRKFERIARFGVFEFENKYAISYEVKIDARLTGLLWYADELSSMIADNIFAIKPVHKADKQILKDFMEDIVLYKEAMQYAKKETTQRDRKSVEIDELVFFKILDFLIQIKINVLEALNRSDLIFKGIDDFDPEHIKESLLEELMEKG